MIHSGKWIFIRFNPDRKDIDYEDLLENEIDKQIERIENEQNEALLEIIKIFLFNNLLNKIWSMLK